MKIFLILLLLFPLTASSLEVDEKLTVRVLKTSESRKTIMVNRGIEDGLVEGDHARFIVTAGIVARAVCLKVSPTRSVWSVYRLVNADFIVKDSVMTLKITPPVKITKDESQALVREDVPSRVSTDPTTLGIPLADGAQDLAESEGLQEDMRALEEGGGLSSLVEKTIEIFGVLNISGVSATTKSETGDQTFSNSQGSHHVGLGAELYTQREREWYSRFSLFVAANIMRADSQAFNGAASTNEVTEFQGGVNWHPGKLPSSVLQFIPFFQLSVNLGSVRSSFKPGADAPGGPEYESTGTSNGFSVGGGYKFYSPQGFGARVIVDYYFRNESYKEGDDGNKFSKTVSGPRLMLGLSYRF